MKNFIYFILVISLTGVLYSFGFFEEDPNEKSNNPHNTSFYFTIDSKQMNGNNISTWYRNNGSFNRDPITGNSGFEWPKDSLKFARYASGLWIGAKVGDDTLICLAEYDYEYLPGYIDNNGNPQGADDPLRRIYVINKGDTISSDYLNWPVDQGAYVNENGKPYLMGNQTMFYTYTDGYPEVHENSAGHTAPLKAQILQTNWCFNQPFGTLKDVIFTEYRIINRSNLPWTKCYIAQWTDDDLGSATDDANGCDSILNLGYIYNFDNNDDTYGLNPPAVGFLYIKGGITESPDDTVKYYSPPGSNNIIIKPNYKNIITSSINTLLKSHPIYGDPSNYKQTYQCLEGKSRGNAYWINPQTGNASFYPYSGNPESGTGWNMDNSGDRRFLISTGPLTLNPGDTQIVIIAQLIARGSNNLNSVTKLKRSAEVVQKFFDNNFDVSINSPLPLTSSYAPGTGKIYLSWDDACERISMPNKLSGGTYQFQGYNIYRIRPNNSNPSEQDTILIKTYDKPDGIRNIKDSIFLEDYQSIVYGIVQRGSDNGISRYIVLDKDTVSGNAFTNGSEYKFTVTAYYYDPTGGIYTLPKVYESSKHSNIVKVIPQDLNPGTQAYYEYGDTIDTDQKDYAVLPVILDPVKQENEQYMTTFGIVSNSLVWNLYKIENGKQIVIFQDEKSFNVPGNAIIYNGISLSHRRIRDSGVVRDPKISGRKKAWDYIPPENLWFEGPDTQAVKTAKVIRNRQYQSISIGMSFPTAGTFRNTGSRIFANGSYFSQVLPTNPVLTGGPLRKIQFVFGQNSKSYRYVPIDSTLENTPYADFTDVPFSVYAIDELDSSNGTPRKLNTGFLDTDNNGIWDPDTSLLGKYHFTYILASNYDSVPNSFYTGRNPGHSHPTVGFQTMDVMYVWHPRVKKTLSGLPMNYTDGDKMIVSPYRITRGEFVPGYQLKYNWNIKGTELINSNVNTAEVEKIKAFPNPYYGMSELEYDSGGEKFIYFSHLPAVCDIYIYSLNGSLVRKIQRNTGDPENSLEKWDLMNSGKQKVASGMYIVYVDCKGAGTKTLKIAVFTSK